MKKSANKLNPRLEYLSYSKKKLFERDRELFTQVYFEDGQVFETEKMRFGKNLAEALEEGLELHDNAMIAHALLYLPKYPIREYKVKIKFSGVSFLSSFDGFDPKLDMIGEVKSGTTHWTQNMVDKCEQLTFYAMVFYFKKRRMPRGGMRLHWINTATGEIKTFETKRSVVQVLRYFNECKVSWGLIKKFIKSYTYGLKQSNHRR